MRTTYQLQLSIVRDRHLYLWYLHQRATLLAAAVVADAVAAVAAVADVAVRGCWRANASRRH